MSTTGRLLTDRLYSLRPYQRHTVEANQNAWAGRRRPTGEGRVNLTANVLATGLGKTVIGSELAAGQHRNGGRTIVLTHREELADQWMAKLHSMTPGASIGLVRGPVNQWDRDIVVASVPSIGTQRQRERRGIPADRFTLGIADECHHSAADTWRSAMGYFGAFGRSNGLAMPWAGFTATLDRGDDRGLGEIWQEVVADYDIAYGIKNNYLVRPVGRRVRVKDLMLSEVKRSRGDFQDDDLGAAMENADAGEAIAKAYVEHAAERRAVLFAPTVHAARRWAQDMNNAGVTCEVITGSTSTEERTAVYERFRTGRTMVLSSVMVLTEGWDAPWAEVAIMARPTKSTALYIQCVGRVLRPFAAGGKTGALVLDVVGVSAEHGLASLKNLALDDAIRVDGRPAGVYEDDDDQLDTDDDDGPAGEYFHELPEYNGGELVSEEVELFADRPSVWLQTTSGVWFVPTRESYFYIWPSPGGTFGVGVQQVRARKGFGTVLEKGLTFEGAMAWAERYALAADDGVAARTARWRKNKPSPAMVAEAMRLGLDATQFGDARQGEIGDAITQMKADLVLPTAKV